MHRLLVGIGGLALAGGVALAHHGWGTYDPSRVVTLEGPVLQSKYEFPHGEIVLEGEGKRWTIILAPPSRMGARGLRREDIAVGRKVKVEGYPSKVTDAEMRAERVTVEGRVVEMR
jgi:hypothetical protein